MTSSTFKPIGATTALAALAVGFSTIGAMPAQAAVNGLYGGGGVISEKVYRDIFNCYGSTSGGELAAGLASPPATCTGVTPYNSSVEILYTGVGSGNGGKSFINHDATLFDGTAGSPRKPDSVPVTGTTDLGSFYGTGVGAAWVPDGSGNGNPFPKVTFADNNNPLAASDLATYNSKAAPGGWGPAIQIPSLIFALAIPFNPTAGWSEHGIAPVGGGGSSLVDLSTATLCGIFTGAITSWSDAAIKADNGGVQLGSGPITVVYRSDNAGQTVHLVNALIQQCAGTAHAVPASWQSAIGNTAGSGNGVWFTNVKNAGLLPANFVGATGSTGVKAAINATVGATGYNSPDFSQPVDPTGPRAANLQIFSTVGHAAKYAAPTPINATQIFAKTKPPSFTAGSCSLPNGCAPDPTQWAVVSPKPSGTTAYPIGAFDLLELYSCYASATDVTSLVGTAAGHLGLWRWYFGSAAENGGHVNASLAANGFAPVPKAWVGAVKKLLTTNQPTAIGTPGKAKTACASVAGAGA